MTSRASNASVRVIVVLVALLSSVAANADMLIDMNVMVNAPSVPTAETLNIGGRGTLTMTVTDLDWPKALASLSFAITDSTEALVTAIGGGSLTYDVDGPMALFANVYATPDASTSTGLYHLSVSFAPAVVPLPAAGVLLLSGLFGISFTRRKHATVTNSVVQ